MVNPSMVRDLAGTLQKAEMGLLIVMAPVTKGMKVADTSGTYVNEMTGGRYPRVQIVTVASLLARTMPTMPSAILPYMKAKPYQGKQLRLAEARADVLPLSSKGKLAKELIAGDHRVAG